MLIFLEPCKFSYKVFDVLKRECDVRFLFSHVCQCWLNVFERSHLLVKSFSSLVIFWFSHCSIIEILNLSHCLIEVVSILVTYSLSWWKS